MTDMLYIAYGDDAFNLATTLLCATMPEQGLAKDAKIIIKPNLVVAKPWTDGATTNPAVADAVVTYFNTKGYKNITIAEGAWIGASTKLAFDVCGYNDLAKKHGVPFLDTKTDDFETLHYKGYSFEIAKCALKADLIVNLPVIKGHCQTQVTCSMKNLKGVISDGEKRRFHGLGLHTPIAYLNKLLPNVFTIADGIYGDIDFEEGGNPVRMDTMLASFDRVLLDAYAATLLGYHPADIGYINVAANAGLGDIDLPKEKLQFLNAPTAATHFTPTGKAGQLKHYINEAQACSACVGNLLRALHTMDTRTLDALPHKVAVGQGFVGANPALGIGKCACQDGGCVACPPTAQQITRYLQHK